MTPRPIDRAWLAAHPLPPLDGGTDKNSRGRVLAVGGSARVPGGLRLTGEAALRVGASKLRLATIEAAAVPLGVAFPEAGIVALPAGDDGEIGPEAGAAIAEQVETCEALVLGPGMGGRHCERVSRLTRAALAAPRAGLGIVLDAAPLACATGLEKVIAAHDGRVVLTPHHGEMATLTGVSEEAIAADPQAAAIAAARTFGAIVALKAACTFVAAPDGTLLSHPDGCIGLAVGGSGDVLAGCIAGLLARGAPPVEAAAWGVWLHGRAGHALTRTTGAAGFLARELLPTLPGLLNAACGGDATA